MLTIGLAKVLFPVVLILGLTGLLVGILQSYDEFTIPALAPVVWNLVIIGVLVGLQHQFKQSIYAYAVAWLVATDRPGAADRLGAAADRLPAALRVRLARSARQAGVPADAAGDDRSRDRQPRSAAQLDVRGARLDRAPRAIQLAFLIYMLPQGIFSVAVATVLFPTLSRQASRRDVGPMRHTLANGMRQINLLLIPAAAGIMVLADPITTLVFQHGNLTADQAHGDLRSRCSGSRGACRSAA